MKNTYTAPECEIIVINEDDVITTSGVINAGGNDIDLIDLPVK